MVGIDWSIYNASDVELTTMSSIRDVTSLIGNGNIDIPMVWVIGNIKLVINVNGDAKISIIRTDGEVTISVV